MSNCFMAWAIERMTKHHVMNAPEKRTWDQGMIVQLEHNIT